MESTWLYYTKRGKKQGKYAETNNLRIPLTKVGISSTIINFNQKKRSWNHGKNVPEVKKRVSSKLVNQRVRMVSMVMGNHYHHSRAHLCYVTSYYTGKPQVVAKHKNPIC